MPGLLRTAYDRTRRLIADRTRLLRLLPHGDRTWVTALFATHLVVAALPTLTALAIGQVTAVLSGPVGRDSALPAVAALGGLLLGGQLVTLARDTVQRLVALGIDGRVRRAVRDLATAADGIAHLEERAFADDASRAADKGSALGRTRSPGTASVGQVTVMFRMLSALVSTALLALYFPVLAVVALIVSLFVRSVLRRQWTSLANTLDSGAEGQRKVFYLSDLAVRGAPKEVRLFGLAGWLAGRFRAAAFGSIAPTWRQLWGVLRRQWWTVAILAGAFATAVGVPAAAALAGDLRPDQLVTCLFAAIGLFAITAMGHEAFDVDYGLNAARALDRLTDRYGGALTAARTPPPVVPRTDQAGPPLVCFEDVTFTYPDADRPVFAGLCLTLRPAESVALIGQNGVGKTTLVKLLAGLYRPTAGRITVDGHDLAEMDQRAWRSRMTALFQDYIRYPTTLRENVALSAPHRLDDLDAVRTALHRAGASNLPVGMDTLLWPDGSGGVDLSGGQWQRVAIARVLFAAAAGRQLIVLDEPTAHLDMRAEAEFYERVVRSVSNMTTILVSHRLSTVRPADRIVLLRDGRVAEQGSHSELLALGADYSRLFRMQAEAFLGERS